MRGSSSQAVRLDPGIPRRDRLWQIQLSAWLGLLDVRFPRIPLPALGWLNKQHKEKNMIETLIALGIVIGIGAMAHQAGKRLGSRLGFSAGKRVRKSQRSRR